MAGTSLGPIRAGALAVGLALAALAQAQDPITPVIPSRQAPFQLDSGAVENAGAEPAIVYVGRVQVEGAPWVRLNFEQTVLAGDPANGNASYLRITSLHDGAFQTMNRQHVAEWSDASAYFNGDEVEIEIIAYPRTGPNRIVIGEVTVGEPPVGGPDTICGPTDDRILSSDPRAARLVSVGCTAWLINDCNHCFLTAGHCSPAGQTVQFNVPLSLSNGTIQHPPPQDQYTVETASVQRTSGGVGNDWAYFGCERNTTTLLYPYQVQQAAFDLASTPPPVSGQQIRITGYGTTNGTTAPREWSQVQKTHAGPYVSFSGTTVRYATDTTGGNSGSPVINESTGQAIGIHTHGGCSSSGGSNIGTGVNHTGLQAALASPRGVCAACPTCTKGDVNNDGNVRGDDVGLFVQTMITGGTPGSIAFCATDMNNNGVLEPGADAALFVQCLVNQVCP